MGIFDPAIFDPTIFDCGAATPSVGGHGGRSRGVGRRIPVEEVPDKWKAYTQMEVDWYAKKK